MSRRRAKLLIRTSAAASILILFLIVFSAWWAVFLVGRHACVTLFPGIVAVSWESDPMSPKKWIHRRDSPRLWWTPSLILEGGVAEVGIPLWIPLLGTSAMTAAGLRGLKRSRGRCASCGYDQAGIPSGRCPECGAEAG
jgi:hypothetical protein